MQRLFVCVYFLLHVSKPVFYYHAQVSTSFFAACLPYMFGNTINQSKILTELNLAPVLKTIILTNLNISGLSDSYNILCYNRIPLPVTK